jgi:hypothetical protein
MSRIGDVTGLLALFAEDAVLERGAGRWRGRAEIEHWLRGDIAAWGGSSSLRFEIIDQPLVTVSPDGARANGRWQTTRFLGDGRGRAVIEAGLYENEYLLDDGLWKITAMRYFPQSSGEYHTGWTNADAAGLPIVQPHFTPDQAGRPIPGVARVTAFGAAAPAVLAARIDRLNAEDDVRNLHHAWGYYVDRRMWTDVVDLFDRDGRMTVDGIEYEGPGIRRGLERMGPEGLTDGVLNDHVIFDTVVDVHSDGETAHSCGIRLGLIAGGDGDPGAWEFSAFESRAVRRDGIWRLRDVTVSTILRADYREGWGRGGAGLDDPGAVPGPLPFRRRTQITPTATRHEVSAEQESVLADLERRLARSRAYDAVENVSAAYGYYLDDFQWPQMAGLFAARGHKQSPFVGYYIGPDRILEAATTAHGSPKAADARRERLVVHWRPQNVITVSHDARSASLRTRLFQTRTAAEVMPEWTGVHSGSYANDQAVLEGDVWRLWSVTIDEYYFSSPTWAGGWASAPPRTSDAPNPPARPWAEKCPPDIPLSVIGDRARGFRGGPGRTRQWPEIVPMWFHYRNLVSGRAPENYWPDCVPSAVAAETSMTGHGYRLPPAGPAVDGIETA